MLTDKKKIVKNVVFYSMLVILAGLLVYHLLWKEYLADLVNYAFNGKQEKNVKETVEINDVELPYFEQGKTYLYPISKEDIGKDITINIKVSTNDNVKHFIDGKEFNKSIELTTKAEYNKELEIYSNNSFYYEKKYIKFTNLPVISINNNSKKLSKEYSFGNVSIIDPDYIKNESEYCIESDINIRLRGTSGLNAKKKSYRVRLLEKNNNNRKKNLSLLGLRNDSDWILDSLYADSSKIRNLLSYNLWNLMNEDISEEYYAKLNGKFVEVFMNGEYAGLYVLKEPIDEETLNLKETSNSDSGILLKGVDHSMPQFNEEDMKNVKSSTYYGFEIKYPKDLKDNSQYWYIMLSKMKNYYTGNVSDEVIENTFYMDNFVNYRLLLLAIKALDNYEPKNVYFSLKDLGNDTKIILTPWDLDLTFGIDWLEHGFGKNYEAYDTIVDLNLNNSENCKNNLKSRWKYLRKNVFNDKVIDKLITDYYNELTITGAIDRENSKWNAIDLSVEFNEIKDWCKKRFIVVDEYIDKL